MKDGGPAFPNDCVHGTTDTADGMSLRDYFAAKALQGAISNGALERIMKNVAAKSADLPLDKKAEVTNGLLAKMMYEIADAMLAEKNATQ